jgi:outer membrane receptor protein involved in Fe transport
MIFPAPRKGALLLLSLATLAGPVSAQEPPAAGARAALATATGTAQRTTDEPAAAIGDEIVVSAGRTEQRLSEIPVKVDLLTRAEIDRLPAQASDEVLRFVPSFNLQRPESSRVLNLSSQGVSFRGLGGTSASRSLVLVDGVPLNEPFAGWISWSRVPTATIERIEVVPGGAAGAWGNQALGGVIHLITRAPEPATAMIDARAGSRSTVDTTLLGSHVKGPIAFSADAGYYDSDGHSEVPKEIQGPVDTANRSRSRVFDARVEISASDSSLWTIAGSYLDDWREGGNVLSREWLELASLRVGVDHVDRAGGSWQGNLFALDRQSSNTRGSISDDRTEVEPRRNAFDSPSDSVGAGFTWTRPAAADAHHVVAGADALWTDSEVNEDTRWDGERFVERSRSGGRQTLAGAFVQDAVALGERLRLSGGLRVDHWISSDGVFHVTDLTDGDVLFDDDLAEKSKTVFSPNLGLRFQADERLGLSAAVFQSFRAPTPNELFKSSPSNRSYLAANSELDPERIDLGFEAGVDFAPRPASRIRLAGFWNEVADAIAEVTVGIAGSQPEVIEPCGELRPGGVCSQRRNLEKARTKGVEAEAEARLGVAWRLRAAYTWTDARVIESKTDPRFEGLWLRRVPEHQAAAQASWDSPEGFGVSAQLRFHGDRYEDDLNVEVIDDSLVADLRLSYRFRSGLELALDVQNVADAEVEVGRNPDYAELGQPRTLLVGLRYRWQGARGATS